MSEENMEASSRRRRRVQRLKKCIILTVLFFIFLPTVLCVVLFVKMYNMDKYLRQLSERVDILTEETAEQQDMLRELLESRQVIGQGKQMESETSREPAGYEVAVSEPEPGPAEPVVTVEDEKVTEPAETEEPTVHKVYLTFDDGPSSNTGKILDILDRYDVKATFFVVGKESEADKEALVQIVERGHTLGMHSYSHKYAEIYSSEEEFAADFEKLRSYLEEVTGVTCDVYRFPGGSSNTVSSLDMHVFMNYLDSQGVRFFDWNVSSGDASSTQLSAATLAKNATRGIEKQDTSIILMHDAAGKPTTVEALPTIIENILAMENTVILPITEETEPVQHIQQDNN